MNQVFNALRTYKYEINLYQVVCMHAYYFIDGKIAINNFKTNASLIFIHQHCRRKTDMG